MGCHTWQSVINLHAILSFPQPCTDLWPVGFELIASLGIVERLSKSSNAGIGSRALAKELEIVSVEGNGLRELLDGMDKVSLFSRSLLHGCLANATKGGRKETKLWKGD